LNCELIKELLSSYIDGELDREDIIKIENHLAKCKDCRKLLQDYQSIKKMIRSIEIPKPSKRIHERIVVYPRRRSYFLRFIFSTSLLVVLGALLIPFLRWNQKVTQKETKEYYIMKEEQRPYTEVVYKQKGNFVLTNYEGGSF